MKQAEKKEKRVAVYFTPSEFARLKAAAGTAYVAEALFVYQATMQKLDAIEAASKPVQRGQK